MAGANFYDLHGSGKRISYYPMGRTIAGPAKGPMLTYDDGSSQVECSGDSIKIGPATWAGTPVVALVRSSGIVPGAVTSLFVLIPDVNPNPGDGAVHLRTYAILANHRGVAELGPGQLETYNQMALTGTAALIKLPG
jgi:hypothetical protein